MPASDDLAEIVSYIRRDKPEAARRLAERILSGATSLILFPQLGRPGVVQGTRELAITQSNYLIVYRLVDDAVEILRVRHGAAFRH